MSVSSGRVRVNSQARPTFPASLRASYDDRDVLAALVRRELRTRYRRSILGWLWSLANPAFSTIVYTFVFSVFLKVAPPPGVPSRLNSFPLFLLCGLLPWSFFVGAVTTSASALLNSGGIVTKVRFAREHVVLAPVIALAASLVIELFVVVAFLVSQARNPLPYLPVVAVLLVLLTSFTAGLSLLIAPLCVKFRDLSHLLSIVFMAWFYLTPIAYPIDRVPPTATVLGHQFDVHQLLLLNPMARFVQAFRNCLYDLTLPGRTTFVTLILSSFVVLFLGYRSFLRRSHRLIEFL